MIEVMDMMWALAVRSWQLWGCLAFMFVPFYLAVVAVWDLADWLGKGGRR
jgi:hypothetical protein